MSSRVDVLAGYLLDPRTAAILLIAFAGCVVMAVVEYRATHRKTQR